MKVETNLPFGKVDPGLREADDPLDVASVPQGAATVEKLGYDSLGMTETKEDPYVVLAMAAAATSRIQLTTAVAMAFPRSPTITAMSAWTMQRASRGRFTLGLGPQVKGHMERRYGVPWSPPGPWIEEYVGAVRAVWDCWQNGTPLDFHGEHYNLTLMNPLFNPGPLPHPDIPIQLAATNAHMARVSGRIADGMQPHPICTRKYLSEVIVPAIRHGERDAGRPAGVTEVCAHPLVVTAETDEELDAKLTNVRARIAFYASTRAYRAVWDSHDWGDIAEHLTALSRQQRWDQMEQHVTDEMVDTVAVVGTLDQIAQKVHDRYAGLASMVKFSIPVRGPSDLELLGDLVRQIQQAS